MKTTHINQIIDNPQIDKSFIMKELDSRIEYPIFKIKERRVVDQQTGDRVNYATHLCGGCNHKFESIDEINNNIQCPNCGNLLSGYFDCKMEGIEDDFEFAEKEDIIIVNKEMLVSDDYYRENRLTSTIPVLVNQKTVKYSRLFLLEKHNIENNKYLAIRFYTLNTIFDEKNREKGICLADTGNMIIFGDNEIIPVRDNKKSTARFQNLFNDYWNFYAESHIILGVEKELEELINVFFTLNTKFRFNNPFENSKDRKIIFLNLARLDKVNEILKNSNKKVKVPNKIDKLIDDITSRLPEAKPFTVSNDDIFFKDLEEDKINHITKYKFFCPVCKQEEEIDIPDNYFYHSDKEEFVPTCPDCRTKFKKENIKKFFTYNNKDICVQVIDDFDDGIICFSAYYKRTVNRNTLFYTPIARRQDLDIVVVPNTINENTGFAEPIILRYDFIKNSYGKARRLNFDVNTQEKLVKNFATHFNLGWSGIENFSIYDKPNADELSAFIILYRKYPVLEKLMKEGHQAIVRDIIHTFNFDEGKENFKYNLKENDVPTALRLSRNCIKILNEFSSNSHNKVSNLYNLQVLYEQDKNITKEQYKYMQDYYLTEVKIADLCRTYGFTIHKVCEYLERVRLSQCVSPSTALSEWSDYLYASQLIGCDITDKKVRYPSALRTEHDKVVYKKKIIEDKKYDSIFKGCVEKYGERLSYKNDGFLITYPKEISDLFEEGRKLNHCVGIYGDKIKDGESIILFVRKSKEPNEPFYTMEVNPRYNAVVQLHGFNNTYPNPKNDKDLISFVKKWAIEKKISY